jgi:tetratricopeptide (TPR) repeat protein
VLAPPLKYLPALLVPVALAWVLAPGAVTPSPWLSAATVAVVSALCLTGAGGCTVRTGPRVWLAGLLVWAALDAALRPVATSDAARLLATGVVALGLVVVTGAPRGAAWGRLAAVAAGTSAAAWLITERLLHAGRPPGPFGNPNLAATPALLALALAPRLRAPVAVRGVVMAVAVAGIVASGSRAAMVGIVVVAATSALARRGGRRMRFAAALLVVIALVGFTVRLATDRDPLRYERVRIWAVALRVAAAEFPLGCGPSGYADAAMAHNFPREGEFARFARLPDVAESDLLQLAATLGLPGMMLLVGLAWSVVGRLPKADAQAWGVLAAAVVTSAFNSQLMVPAVAWTLALAVGSILPRVVLQRERASRWATVAAVAAVAVAAGAVLALPDFGAGEPPERLVDRADLVLRTRPGDSSALADAEALTWQACAARPRYGRGWRILGSIRLRRAVLCGEADVATAAAGAFARAREVNPLDAWGAVGEGQARRMLGDTRGAWQAFNAAVLLEPNCVPAWLERAVLHLAQGELGPARDALRRAEAAQARARGVAFVSAYELALAAADPVTVEQLRSATGEVR